MSTFAKKKKTRASPQAAMRSMAVLQVLLAMMAPSAAFVRAPRAMMAASRPLRASSEDEFPRLRSAETVSMKSMFERALVLQRAGDLDGAEEEYTNFLDCAKQQGVPPTATAEIYGNIGAIHLRRGDRAAAKESFEASLACTPLGTTHCNLAIIALQGDGDVVEARRHARAALHLGDGPQSTELAERILRDIEERLAKN